MIHDIIYDECDKYIHVIYIYAHIYTYIYNIFSFGNHKTIKL